MRQPKHKNCAVMCCMLHDERGRGREGGQQRWQARERQRVCCVLAYLPRLAVACQASKLAVSDKDNIMAAAAVAAVAVAEAAIKTFTLLGVTFPAANSCQAPLLPPSLLSLSFQHLRVAASDK